MRIKIRNIGPVEEADIELAPLTVFIGPNNSGKSVAATVVYSSLTPTRMTPLDSPEKNDTILDDIRNFMRNAPEEILPDEIPDSVREFTLDTTQKALHDYLAALTEEIRRTTGPSVSALQRNDGEDVAYSAIQISSNNPGWSADITIIDGDPIPRISHLPDAGKLLELLEPAQWDTVAKYYGRDPGYWLALSLRLPLFREAPQRTWYLPAARSGILQSYRALAGSLVRRSSMTEAAGTRGPVLSAVVADFLGTLIELRPEQRWPFADEADRAEREILRGEVDLTGEPFPEVVFRQTGSEYSTRQTSSMVSELAPIVLYLRHLLEPNDLLIIEEPEAHLHPATQVAFARCLVRLVNQGLKVCLTTHSEFFLQQINNAIMASALTEDQAVEARVSTERLDGEKVAAYFFEPTSDGTVVRRLPIDVKEGIPEVSFDEVTEQLYNETIAMDWSLGGVAT